MRHTRKAACLAAFFLVGLNHALPQAITLGADQGVRKTAQSGVRYSFAFSGVAVTPFWAQPDGSAVVTDYVWQRSVAANLELAGLCNVQPDSPAGTFTYAVQSGALPTAVSLNSSTIEGTPSTVESTSATIRCTYTVTGTGEVGLADVTLNFDIQDPDSTAPAAPTGVTLQTRTETTAVIAFDPGMDASGIRNCYLYRTANPSGPSPALKATGTGSPLTDTDLVSTDTKYYTVKCDDNSVAHNLSAASAELQVGPFSTGGGGGGGGGGSCAVALAFEDEFEGSVIDTSKWNVSTNGTQTQSISSTRARGGSKSARFTLAAGNTNYRTELRALADAMGTYEDDLWYGWSVYLDGYTEVNTWEIHGQWHDHQDPTSEESMNPPLAFETASGTEKVRRRWLSTNPDVRGNESSNTTNLTRAPFDQWVDYVVHVVWDYSASGNVGELEIWRGSGSGTAMTKVLTCSPPNCPIGYNDPSRSPGDFFKMGIYRCRTSNASCSSFPARTIYYDSVRMARGTSASFECVNPSSNDGARP